jgi:hypothetical protein
MSSITPDIRGIIKRKQVVVCNQNATQSGIFKYIGGDDVVYKNFYVQNPSNNYVGKISQSGTELHLASESIHVDGDLHINGGFQLGYISEISNTGSITINPGLGATGPRPLIVNGTLDMTGNSIEHLDIISNTTSTNATVRYNPTTKSLVYKPNHHAQFISITSQTLPANTSYKFTYTDAVETVGLSFDPVHPSRIYTSQAGKYKVGTSILFEEQGGSGVDIYFCFALAGTLIANSGSKARTSGNRETSLVYAEIIVNITNPATQYIEIVGYTTSNGISSPYISAVDSKMASSPPIITTVLQLA